MINVTPEVRAEYMTDSVNKYMTVRSDKPLITEVNFYADNMPYAMTTVVSQSEWQEGLVYAWGYDEYGYPQPWFRNTSVVTTYATGHAYAAVSFNLEITAVGYTTPPEGHWHVVYYDADGVGHGYNLPNGSLEGYWNSGGRVSVVFPIPNGISALGQVYFDCSESITVSVYRQDQGALQVNFIDDPDSVPEYLTPPDFSTFDPATDTGWEIGNDNLIYEDFELTESLCSQDNIKFGLCEAAHIDFSMVADVGIDIGDDIRAAITTQDSERDIADSDIFKINWIATEYATTATTVTTNFMLPVTLINSAPPGEGFYSDWSDYIEVTGLETKRIHLRWKFRFDFNDLTGTKPVYFRVAFMAYANETEYGLSGSTYYEVSDFDGHMGTATIIIPPSVNGYTITGIRRISAVFYDENRESILPGAVSCSLHAQTGDVQYRIGAQADVMPEYSEDDLYYANGTLDDYLRDLRAPYTIPLGVFRVADVTNKYRHNLIERKVSAYDKLLLLEQNAADWYTQYMYGVTFDSAEPVRRGFEYPRQIFSTYFSYVASIGLDSVDNYEVGAIATLDTSNFVVNQNNAFGYIKWTYSGTTYYRCYGSQAVTISDPTLLYRVTYDNLGGISDEAIIRNYNTGYVASGKDTMPRGFGTIGGVLIKTYNAGGTETRTMCVNRGDFFMVDPDTATIRVILPSGFKDNGVNVSLCQNIKLQAAPRRSNLVNGTVPLLYYNYVSHDIFPCDTSITGRDVVRSLLEVCGCFFRLDRFKGLPEFVYPQKGGLYPSNTLYPADDLYPRGADTDIVPMGRYISLSAANYTVKDYGRIQILKQAKSADTKSVVEWQYEGDPDKANTYIIDDNIFYCAEEMVYDYDAMPEVSEMLENMWIQISNLGYVPNEAECLGAPWIECGDRVGLLTYNGGLETFVFRRTLKGIQNLRDSYESAGDEVNEAISDFGYIVH